MYIIYLDDTHPITVSSFLLIQLFLLSNKSPSCLQLTFNQLSLTQLFA